MLDISALSKVLDDASIRKVLGHSEYFSVDFEDVLTAQMEDTRSRVAWGIHDLLRSDSRYWDNGLLLVDELAQALTDAGVGRPE